jgi:protein SCO1/2
VGDASAIDQLSRAVGFRYAPDPATHQFAHPAGVVVLAPDGRVASYLGGVSFPAGQLAAAIASANRPGGPARPSLPEVLLRCLHYDPASAGAHDGQVLAALRVAGSAMVLALASLIWGLVRRERARGRERA